MIMPQKIDFEKLFVYQAELYGRAIYDGNSRIANRSHKKINELIKMTGVKAKERILSSLCGHPSESVRLWAASFLFSQNECLAISTIEAIINSNSILGLVAEVTLDKWRSGNLNG